MNEHAYTLVVVFVVKVKANPMIIQN